MGVLHRFIDRFLEPYQLRAQVRFLRQSVQHLMDELAKLRAQHMRAWADTRPGPARSRKP